MKCVECKQPLIGKWKKKFCSHACAAIFNNKIRGCRKDVICSDCGVVFKVANWIRRAKFKCMCCSSKPKIIKQPTQNIKHCKVCRVEFVSKHNRLFCSDDCWKQRSRKYNKVCKRCSSNYKAEKKTSKFCSRSCRSLFLKLHVFAHTRGGQSRSKIEKYISSRLINDFPDIDFIFNDKNTIGLELDIFIPALRMAFELNGIFHYLPIYGENTLTKIQDRDKQKTNICHERGIELVTINLGSGGFTKKHATEIYNLVYTLVNRNKKRAWAV